MNPPRTILELLSDESKWTKGVLARDKDGHQVYVLGDKAVCFCLIGAAHKIYNGWLPRKEALEKLTDTLLRLRGTFVIGEFNDDPKTTFADIIAVVKEAGV